MIEPLSVVTSLGQGALKLKTIIDGLAENQKSLYKIASELIDEIQEIEDIRKGQVSNNLAELDDFLSRLQNDLDRIIGQCKKRVKAKSSYGQRVVGMFAVDKVKEDILELKTQVASAHIRYQRRCNAAMYTKTLNIEAKLAALSETLANRVEEGQKSQGKIVQRTMRSNRGFASSQTEDPFQPQDQARLIQYI